WHKAAQLAQAVSLRTGIEWLRVNRGRCMGALIWQLNECWPGLSWSIIDAEGREKPAYDAVRRAFDDLLITIQPFGGVPWLCVVNDLDREEGFEVNVRRVGVDGRMLAASTLQSVCPAGRVVRV